MAKYRNVQRLRSYYCHSSSRSNNSRWSKVARICWKTTEGRRPGTSSYFSSHTLTKSVLSNSKNSQRTVRLALALWLSVLLTEMSPHKVLPCDNHRPPRLSLDMVFGESTHQYFFTVRVKGATSFWGEDSSAEEMQAMLWQGIRISCDPFCFCYRFSLWRYQMVLGLFWATPCTANDLSLLNSVIKAHSHFLVKAT